MKEECNTRRHRYCAWWTVLLFSVFLCQDLCARGAFATGEERWMWPFPSADSRGRQAWGGRFELESTLCASWRLWPWGNEHTIQLAGLEEEREGGACDLYICNVFFMPHSMAIFVCCYFSNKVLQRKTTSIVNGEYYLLLKLSRTKWTKQQQNKNSNKKRILEQSIWYQTTVTKRFVNSLFV